MKNNIWKCLDNKFSPKKNNNNKIREKERETETIRKEKEFIVAHKSLS